MPSGHVLKGLKDRDDIRSPDFFLLGEKKETALMSRGSLLDGLSVQDLVLSALQV